MPLTILVGTQKGGYLARRPRPGGPWSIEGPLFKGWKVTAAVRHDRGFLIATASDVYGAALHASRDLKSWRQIEKGPSYAPRLKRKLDQVWRIAPVDGLLYAGVSEAGLFVSEDRGKSWGPVKGLNEHRTRAGWQPGFGGLCAHALLADSGDARRLWCGISAVGVFRSVDGGATWEPRNSGVPVIIPDKRFKDIGFCVHALVQDPASAGTLYRQDHKGMFRSRDGGDSWQRIEKGLPSGFGFPLAMHRPSRTLFAFPQESDEYRMAPGGRLRVYRSRDGGDSWEPLSGGLPQEHAYVGVLRAALACDSLSPGGVYLGTTNGTLHASSDLGETWTTLPCLLPRILCVEVLEQG